MRSGVFILIIIFFSQLGFAQEVEHNYPVGPQATNCDSLDIGGLSVEESIGLVRKGIYRFDQSFKLTRKQGLQKGEFYSCNNQTGYLVITFNGKEHLFENVEKSTWNDLISSSYPESYYLELKSRITEVQ